MPQSRAATIPENPWFDGDADVIPMPGDAVEKLPLVNVQPGVMTVNRGVYPRGVVLIPPAQPPGNYAVLPLETTKKDEETVEVGGPDNPNGVVILFKSD
jgi:hypothetical protein